MCRVFVYPAILIPVNRSCILDQEKRKRGREEKRAGEEDWGEKARRKDPDSRHMCDIEDNSDGGGSRSKWETWNRHEQRMGRIPDKWDMWILWVNNVKRRNLSNFERAKTSVKNSVESSSSTAPCYMLIRKEKDGEGLKWMKWGEKMWTLVSCLRVRNGKMKEKEKRENVGTGERDHDRIVSNTEAHGWFCY